MILIDFIHINSPGGISLSKILLEYIVSYSLESNFEILLDKRNSKFFINIKLNKTIISNSEYSRFFFYQRNKKKYNSILCFSNVPPPVRIKAKTLVYFHNELFINSRNLNFTLFKQLIFKLKWIYIKSRNFNYTWIVQTEHIKSLLGKKLGINSNTILKYPLFQDIKIGQFKKNQNSFIYPTSNLPHKNNETLINAFKKVASKTSEKIILTLTINKIEFDDLPQNLKINFLGLIEHQELIGYLKNSKFLIFPSLRESFGLPLIEGVQSNCIIITSNLNFVNELIKPSYIFDPNSEVSISEAISLALHNKSHPKSSIKIKNDIDLIFNKLNNV